MSNPICDPSLIENLEAVIQREANTDARLEIYTRDTDAYLFISRKLNMYPVSVEKHEPTDKFEEVVVLYKNGTLSSVSPMDDVKQYLLPPRDTTFSSPPAVLSEVPTKFYTVSKADRQTMVTASRDIETLLGFETNSGEIHAAFQYVSRFMADEDTRALYKDLASQGDVHIYAQNDIPDRDYESEFPNIEFHDICDELTAWWFVVFRSVEHPFQESILLCKEVDNGLYSGFWGQDSEVTREVYDIITSATENELGRESNT